MSSQPASSSSSQRQQQQQQAQTQAHTASEAAEAKLMKDAAMALSLIAASVLVLRALAASMTLYLSLLPLLYVFGLQTCPPAASFDAKQELRKVLRGDALPPDHPDKPKPGFANFVAGAMAALTSELATLPGYEVDMFGVAGAAWVATVTLPTSDLSCTWIGCNHRWYYWGSRKLSMMSNGDSNSNSNSNSAKAHTIVPPESASLNIGGTNITFDFGGHKTSKPNKQD